jgi:transposase
MTIPGVGPRIATTLVALAPPPQTFRRGRDFAAWLGLTPRQHSTGGKQRLGATTRMGERPLRRVHTEARPGTWLAGMLRRKPPLLVRAALANSERCGATGPSPPRTARIVWALMKNGEVYRVPAMAA